MVATSLGQNGLDARMDFIKADGDKELQEIKKQLLFEEAGVVVEDGVLLVLENI
jgi:hypothetical protein